MTSSQLACQLSWSNTASVWQSRHGFKSRPGLNFFSGLTFTTAFFIGFQSKTPCISAVLIENVVAMTKL